MNISIDLSQKIVESFKNQDFVLVSAKKIPGGGRIDLLGRKGEYAAVVATLPVAGACDSPIFDRTHENCEVQVRKKEC